MQEHDWLATYDDQLRGEVEVVDADSVVRIGPLWVARYAVQRTGYITYRELPTGEELDALIRAALAEFADDPQITEVEWKTRAHDAVPGLLEQLSTHGFVADEPETIMVGEAAALLAADPGVPDGYTLERATTEQQVHEAAALAGRVFDTPQEESAARADELARLIAAGSDSLELWLVRDDRGEVVCTGRLELVDGTDFAGIWMGACAPAHRGKGLYRALTAARAHSALDRGKRYLQSDCTEYSRPVLERAGLIPISTTTPAIWRRGVTTRPG